MDPIHPTFATADPVFYDRPRYAGATTTFELPTTRTWEQWHHVDDERWAHWAPSEHRIAEQGWKIHLSATPETAMTVLTAAATYCHDQRIPFKHLRNDGHLLATLAKDADRPSGGKFVTVYPTPAQLHGSVVELDRRLGGTRGPYILSDLRWNDGPVHVRYGAFTLSYVSQDGSQVPAIRNLTTGAYVPDVRAAQFVVPEWVTLPDFIGAQVNKMSARPPKRFPTVTGVRQHSNAGGVYDATVDGTASILKEARPHTGYTPDGRDAVTRLAAEEATLRALPDGFPAPRVISSFAYLEHRFLVTERVAGRTLSDVVAATNPLGARNASTEDIDDYRRWAESVTTQLSAAIDALHRAGRTHGDLHPGNVLVDARGLVTLIDFEMSVEIGAGRAVHFGVPGFVANSDDPVLQDEYALACVEMHLYLPLTPLLQLDAGKAVDLPRAAAGIFGLPPSWARLLTRRLRAGLDGTGGLRRRSSTSEMDIDVIARTLVEDADFGRADRLWPGDPHQFTEAPYSLSGGALGVAVALASAGHDPGRRVHGWVHAAASDISHPHPAGLMNGLSGAMWACRRLGWNDLADTFRDRLRRLDWTGLGPGLATGAAGLGLALLADTDGGENSLSEISEILHRLETHWRRAPLQDAVRAGRGGLFAGASGGALLALRMFDRAGDDNLLETARQFLHHDLASLTRVSDGSLHVNEGWRTLPYLGFGSAGIGLVLANYIHLSGDEEHLATLGRIVDAACSPFTAQVGLAQGRAGLIVFLTELRRLGLDTAQTAAALEDHLAQLHIHAIRSPGRTRFAGNGLLRASCDLATGAAGVLSAMAAHKSRRSPAQWLPFLGPPTGNRRELKWGGERYGVSTVLAGDGTL